MTDNELFVLAESISGIGAWHLDDTNHALRWTPQAFRLHGLPPASGPWTLNDALGSVSPPDRAQVAQALAHALAEGRDCEFSYTAVHPDGQVSRLHCKALCQLHADGRRHLVGTVQPAALQRAMVTEDSLDFAVAAAGVGVWEMDLQTGQEVWSDHTLALYGLPPGSPAPTREEWRARYLHSADIPRVDARAAEFLSTRKPYELDYRIRRADDGSIRWLHSRAAFAFGGDRRVLGVSLDITEERLAQERAQQAAQLLDHAATQVGFGFGYREPGGEVGFWSPQLKRLFGLPPDAPTPDRSELGELISETDRERVFAELMTPIAPGELREFEFGVRRGQDGRPRQLTTRAITVYEAGEPTRTYFALVDLTELRRKDRQVDELMQRMRLAAEAGGIGAWERDARTGASQWDATTLAHFGMQPHDPVPSREAFLDMVHPDDRLRVAAALRAADEQHQGLDVEYRVRLADGTERWLRSRGNVLRDEQGHPVRSIGVCFETTAQRRAEAAQQARALAEQANAAKTEFLSRISHELRTPLNAVLGFAQLLALDQAERLSASQRERVDHIQAAGWHLLALVNDVLDLSRIESRQAQMVFSRVPVAMVVQECIAMIAPAATAQQVTLDCQGVGAAVVWTDRTRLKQVLLNLFSNAIKYNRPGGRVAIAAGPLDGGRLQISVRDTGLGLGADQLERLFEPFNRLGRETSTIEGTGLGLALCKLIVEQLGGSISASSTPGQGSEFRVQLPVAQA